MYVPFLCVYIFTCLGINCCKNVKRLHIIFWIQWFGKLVVYYLPSSCIRVCTYPQLAEIKKIKKKIHSFKFNSSSTLVRSGSVSSTYQRVLHAIHRKFTSRQEGASEKIWWSPFRERTVELTARCCYEGWLMRLRNVVWMQMAYIYVSSHLAAGFFLKGGCVVFFSTYCLF